MLNERQSYLLRLLVRHYIETARPVGSSTLVEEYDLEISPATVRNDFSVLEEEGYIVQPHTSAGRIPTLQGYQFYVEHLEQEVALARKFELRVRAAAQRDEQELTRTLATLTGESVVWIASNGRIYQSGIGQLLAKPEFEDESSRLEVGGIFDRLDEVLERLADRATKNVGFMIGDETVTPSSQVSMVSMNLREGKKFPMLMVIGPLRMDYDKALALLTLVRKMYE